MILKNISLFAILVLANSFACAMEPHDLKSRQYMLRQYTDTHTNDALAKLVAEEKAAGRTLDPKGHDGLTPFFCALMVGNTKAARLFFDAGANYTLMDKDGRTAFHLAAQGGDEYIVRELLQKGVAPDVCDKEGNTPLHLLTSKGRWFNRPYTDLQVMMQQALCADLILKAQEEKQEVARLLALQNKKDKTPVQLAQGCNSCVLSVFVKYGAAINPDDMPLIADAHLKCMWLLHADMKEREETEKEREEAEKRNQQTLNAILQALKEKKAS